MPGPIAALRDPDLETEVAALYSSELAYHNFRHALDTLDAADEITRKCVDEGIRVDAEVVYYALLFHDAGFLDDHDALGFATKEAYAADLAAKNLARRGVARSTIDKVVAAILSTHKDASFVTTEQKAVRAADLNLKAEYEMLNGKRLDWSQWVANVSATIRFYLSQEIRLTTYFSDGNGHSRFHNAVRANLDRLIAEARS